MFSPRTLLVASLAIAFIVGFDQGANALKCRICVSLVNENCASDPDKIDPIECKFGPTTTTTPKPVSTTTTSAATTVAATSPTAPTSAATTAAATSPTAPTSAATTAAATSPTAPTSAATTAAGTSPTTPTTAATTAAATSPTAPTSAATTAAATSPTTPTTAATTAAATSPTTMAGPTNGEAKTNPTGATTLTTEGKKDADSEAMIEESRDTRADETNERPEVRQIYSRFRRSILRENEYDPVCYKLVYKVNDAEVVERGCAPKENACDLLKQEEPRKSGECYVCEKDGCNGSSRLSLGIASIVVPLGLVAILGR